MKLLNNIRHFAKLLSKVLKKRKGHSRPTSRKFLFQRTETKGVDGLGHKWTKTIFVIFVAKEDKNKKLNP